MNILLGFLPYIAFYLLARYVAVELALWAALALAIANAAYGWARRGLLKMLEIGTVALFATLAAGTAAAHWSWTLMGVRLAVDGGLLAIVLISLAVGRPFTLQYARERTPEALWASPIFLAVNRRITWVWAAAFAVLVASHAALVVDPTLPVWLDIAVTAVALLAAFRFTTWYPAHIRRRARALVAMRSAD